MKFQILEYRIFSRKWVTDLILECKRKDFSKNPASNWFIPSENLNFIQSEGYVESWLVDSNSKPIFPSYKLEIRSVSISKSLHTRWFIPKFTCVCLAMPQNSQIGDWMNFPEIGLDHPPEICQWGLKIGTVKIVPDQEFFRLLQLSWLLELRHRLPKVLSWLPIHYWQAAK